MKLHKYNLTAGTWGEEAYPFPHTLAGAMFSDVDFAIIHVDPDDAPAPEEVVQGLPEGYQLDFATSAKKNGDFIISSEPVAPIFWDTPEEAVGYGSNLLTPCWAFPPEMLSLSILVVEDGEYNTGDCHGKASLALWARLEGDVQRACQFRLASPDDGILAKGTLVVDSPVEGLRLKDEGIDLVLPVSAFKSSRKPEPGRYTWDCWLGVVAWSGVRPTKMGWQVAQWFSWEAVEADLLPRVEAAAAQLLEAATDTRALAEYLRLDAEDHELPLLDVVLADEHGLLNQHPYVVRGLARMLRQRWLHLARGGGMKWPGLMALPNDDLPDGAIATHDVPEGEVLVTRYPLRSWADLRVLWNVGGGHGHRGVVYMNHKTAALIAGDFDGDFFQVTPSGDYPALTEEIRGFAGKTPVDILKVKDRRASPMDQENLARVMLDNADNMVGLIATLIARVNIGGMEDLVPQLAQELQIGVDKFKYNLDHDYAFLDAASELAPKVAWLRDHKHNDVYRLRPMRVRPDEGTVGKLVAHVNALWKCPAVLSRPLAEFKDLLPEPADGDIARLAVELNSRYGKLIGEALKAKDDGLSKVFQSLHEWAEGVENQTEWTRALWHAVHKTSSQGTGSLAFQAFPSEIAKALQEAEAPDSSHIAIVGLRFHAYNGRLEQFDGARREVKFALRPVSGKLRMCAVVNGEVLGVVSPETPVRQGRRIMALAHSTAGKGRVVYAS